MPPSPLRRKSRGQSLVELALLLPVLLIMLSGLIEFGFALNQFLNVLDGGREGARYGSDGDPTKRASCTNGVDNDNDGVVDDCAPPAGTGVSGANPDDYLSSADLLTGSPDSTCRVTNDYYMQIACVVTRTLSPTVTLDPARDDIVVSIYRIYSDTVTSDGDDTGILGRLPDYSRDPDLSAHDPISSTLYGQWRLFGNHTSKFTQPDIQNNIDVNAPGAGVLVVEVFYDYQHILGLPWITVFVDNPLPLHSFTIIPVPAVEPRPTPTPTPTPTHTSTSTRTSTPTPTDTPVLPPTDTPTPSDTPPATDTPTATTTPEGCGVLDPNLSTVTTSTTAQWADGDLAATITVSLIDNCGLPYIPAEPVELESSRGALDLDPALLSWVGNQFTFLVKSVNVGTSTFSATANPLTTPITLDQTATVDFVCLDGSGSTLSFIPSDVQFGFANPQNPPLPLAHSLRTLTVAWDDLSDTRLLMSVKMGATIIWSSGTGAASPLTINAGDWISATRVINPGASKSLVLTYNVAASPGTYTLSPITWDDGAGGSICASDPVSATR